VAVLVRWAGSEDFNRYKMPAEEFVRQIESAMPGLYEWRLSDLLVYEAKSGHFYTDLSKEYQLGDLLKNRGYKQGYSGTSDRGPNHDPRTRDNRSDEYWRRNERAPELEDFYAAVVRGCGVTDWKRYL
jgi:hypothetical protein